MPDLNQLLETLLRVLLDLNQPLEKLLGGLEAGLVTNLLLWLLLVIFVFAIVSKMLGRFPRFTAYTPAFLISLGIFGTFVGIVIGLVDFNPNQIDKSISDLLEGLKTAFISSIAGLGLSLLFRFLTTFSLPPFTRARGGDEEIDIPQRILDALNEQTQLLKATQKAIAGEGESSLTGQVRLLREDHKIAREELKEAHEKFADQLWRKFAEQTQLLEATQEAIAGEGESSLAGQVRLLREDHKSANEEFTAQLWQKLDEFAEIMSRSATEQVIEALKEVITDFNQNLTEQFGDNFKELNAAVEKLVEWQENYREQLEQLHKLYEESTAAITLIEQRCALIPQSMDKLEPIIETANHQIAELEQHLAAFAEMRDKATEAIPQIQNQTQQMTDDIAASVSLASECYKQLSQDTEELQKNITERLNELLTGIKQLQINTANSLASFLKDVKDLQQELTNGFKEIQQQMEATFKETLSRTEGTVQKQLQALNDATEQALTKAVNEMGENLGKISGKFAEDYQELTETMADVVEKAANFDKKR